jgi:hypothetical protein
MRSYGSNRLEGTPPTREASPPTREASPPTREASPPEGMVYDSDGVGIPVFRERTQAEEARASVNRLREENFPFFVPKDPPVGYPFHELPGAPFSELDPDKLGADVSSAEALKFIYRSFISTKNGKEYCVYWSGRKFVEVPVSRLSDETAQLLVSQAINIALITDDPAKMQHACFLLFRHAKRTQTISDNLDKFLNFVKISDIHLGDPSS